MRSTSRPISAARHRRRRWATRSSRRSEKPGPNSAADAIASSRGGSRADVATPWHTLSRREALKYAAASALAVVLPACGRQETPAAARPFAEGALRFDFRHRIRDGNDDLELIRARVEPTWG